MIVPNLQEKSEQKNHKTEHQSRVTDGANGSKTKLKKRSFKDVLVNGKNDNTRRDKSVEWKDELCSLNAINSDCNRIKNKD